VFPAAAVFLHNVKFDIFLSAGIDGHGFTFFIGIARSGLSGRDSELIGFACQKVTLLIP
jgi:hypothetical protein